MILLPKYIVNFVLPRSVAMLFILLLGNLNYAQSDFKLAVSGELSLGTYLVDLQNKDIEPWRQNIPATVHIVPKMQLRWRDFVSINAGGGIALYNYTFGQRAATYNITLLAMKLEASVLGYIPFEGRKLDAMNFGCGVGILGLSGSERTTQEK